MTRILVIRRDDAPSLPQAGCWSVGDLDFIRKPLWRERMAVEYDESLLQPVAYLVLLDGQGRAWCYRRVGGDARLDGRSSCGVGGHVDEGDQVCVGETDVFDPHATLQRTLRRELAEELMASADDVGDLRLRGLIHESHSPIGRVHLGVLYTGRWTRSEPPRPRPDESLMAIGFLPVEAIVEDTHFELWSRLAARELLAGEPNR